MKREMEKIELSASLQDLKQKLMALDMLMHGNFVLENTNSMNQSIVEGYYQPNSFTDNKNI